MGQYYTLVNLDKKEKVEAHRIGCGMKLWEWAANPQGSVLVLLCGWSTELAGGDPDWYDPDIREIAGRWAGDRIALVGDYYDPEVDVKRLNLPTWDEIEEYTDISRLLVRAWNKFIEIPDLKFEPYERYRNESMGVI